MPRLETILVACFSVVACGGGAAKKDDRPAATNDVAEKKAAEEAAEAKEAAAAAAKADAERGAMEEEAQRAYEAAKGALEPLAKLPKKHPKGFAAACAEMLEQYDTFVKTGLAGEDLTRWTEGREDRERFMRRDCHNRPVEVVVCETAVLKKAPGGTDLGHITRVCTEKFDQPG